MSSKSKSSGSNSNKTNQTISRFDRGSIDLLRLFPPLTNTSNISLQLLLFALLEVLTLHLTGDDPIKSRLLFQLQLHFLQISQIVPASMTLTAQSVRKWDHFHKYVRILRESIQTALGVLKRPSSSSDNLTITNLLQQEYQHVVRSKINIDIPQPDIQLKVHVPLTMNGTIIISDFDNIVVCRYVQDFYELGKLGQGAFGSVFRARNRLDNCLYAIKKIIFNENTDRTRRQAKNALREVRVLASLTHPNIVQYHCAWLELVPVQTRARRTSSSSSMKTSLPQIKQLDSLDEMIQFEGQSAASEKKTDDRDDQSPQKSSTTSNSQEDDEDESEMFASGMNGKYSDLEQYHSDGGTPGSVSAFKATLQHSTSCYGNESEERFSNKQLIPLHSRNQNIHPMTKSDYINAKIVLFIQMQSCDTTLHDWLRYRDQSIIEEFADAKQKLTNSLSELGQKKSWQIFEQLLTAVQYLHSKSFVHRDIKPKNIFLAYDSRDRSSVNVKLGDFGLATLLDSVSTPESPDQWTNDESTGVGTALYAPPEQLNSSRCFVTDKSDSYSLGIVLFELFNIFPTEMERLTCLSDLRARMSVEKTFSDSYPFETSIIEQSLALEPSQRPNVEQVLTIYTKELQRRVKKSSVMTKQMIIEQLQETIRDKDRRIQQLELELERKNS